MQADTLDEEAVQLLAFAKDIVTVLGARRMEAEREAEKYFRDSASGGHERNHEGAVNRGPRLHDLRHRFAVKT